MENLTETLQAHLLVGVPVFILIEPMVGEPFPIGEYAEQDAIDSVISLRKAAWGRPIFPIQLARTIKLPAAMHPYLVALNSHDDIWLTNTHEIAKAELASAQYRGLLGIGASAHRIGGWLQTTQSPEVLAAQLSTLMCVNTSVSTQAKYQRLADRRTFSLLSHVVGNTRIQNMLGQIQVWHSLEGNGLLAHHKGTGEPYQITKLNKQEWNVFIQGEAIHTVMARYLGEKQQHVSSHKSMETIYQRVIDALKQADAAALAWPTLFQSDADKHAYASLYLFKPDFMQNTAVQALLQKHNTKANTTISFDALREPIYSQLTTRA